MKNEVEEFWVPGTFNLVIPVVPDISGISVGADNIEKSYSKQAPPKLPSVPCFP